MIMASGSIARSRQQATIGLLALVAVAACPKLLSQTILETQPETLPEQVHYKGWWPNTGSATRSAYAGAQACAPCHAAEFTGWQASEMANALKPAAQSEFLRARPHLSFDWGRYKYRIDLGKGEAIYSVTDGTGTLSVPLLWAYGVGVVGQAFVFRDQGTYSEAEVAYYPQLSGLDVVAGIPRAAPATLQAAFGIPLVPMAAQQCISCHTTAAVTDNRLRVDSAILGVSCEACHGPGAKHVAAMKDRGSGRSSKTATRSAQTVPKFIFNPASLDPADVEDFCGACHRTSLRVQMKGLHGLETVHYEPYRLELSSCWIMSQRITCLNCHNPHRPLARGASAYDAACIACHSSNSVRSAADASRTHLTKICPVGKQNCATCHMPKCRIPLSPFSMSDHFIRVVSTGDACGPPTGLQAGSAGVPPAS
jgi:mono/diheme cytochrome c family protein